MTELGEYPKKSEKHTAIVIQVFAFLGLARPTAVGRTILDYDLTIENERIMV